jgi:hypothetical protein
MSNKIPATELRARHTEKFFTLVDRPTTPEACWGWHGAMQGPYGSCRLGDIKPVKAHVASYLIHHGMTLDQIPDDPTRPGFKLSVLHSCRSKTCCNPRHLSLGTHVENMEQRRREKTKSADRLSFDDVLAVISLYRFSNLTGAAIGRRLEINPIRVGGILRGDHYSHVAPAIPRPIQKVHREAA